MKNTADNIYETNKITACGQIKSPLQFSHKTYGEAFYTFELGIERRSGYVAVSYTHLPCRRVLQMSYCH